MQLNQHTVTDLQKSGLITSRIYTDIPWPSQDSPVTQKRGILPPAAGGEWCRVTNPVYSVINERTAGGEKDSHVESHLRDLWLWKEMICQSDDCLTWKANSLIKMRHLLSDSSERVLLASCVTRHRYLQLECMILLYITVTCLLGPMGMLPSSKATGKGDVYADLQSSLRQKQVKLSKPVLCRAFHWARWGVTVEDQ